MVDIILILLFFFINDWKFLKQTRPYKRFDWHPLAKVVRLYCQSENTGSRPFTEVQPCWTGIMISGWMTIWIVSPCCTPQWGSQAGVVDINRAFHLNCKCCMWADHEFQSISTWLRGFSNFHNNTDLRMSNSPVYPPWRRLVMQDFWQTRAFLLFLPNHT